MLKTLESLPEFAFTRNSRDETVMIIRGEQGYHWDKNLEHFTPEEMNNFRRVTPEQLKAMEIGALFGWDAKGANPEYHKSL